MKTGALICTFLFILNGLGQSLLTPEKLWEIQRVNGGTFSPDGKYVLYTQTAYDLEKNKGNSDIYIYSVESKTSEQLTSTPFSEYEVQWGPNNTIYYLSAEEKGLQIWTISVKGTDKKRISDFNDIELEGFKVAPDASFIVTIEAIKVRPDVHDLYPDLPKANVRIETDLMYRHWDHWDDYKKRHLLLHRISGEKVSTEFVDLLENEPFDGILPPFGGSDQFTISPDSKMIVYTSKKLQGKNFALSTNSDLYSYDIGTGNTKNLTEGRPGYDVNPHFSKDGKQLAWLSMEHDGFESDKNNIVVMELGSGQVKNLTASIDVSVSDFCWSADSKAIYYKAPIEGTVQLFVYDSKKNENRQLTEGWHDYTSLDVSAKYIVSGIQSMVHPSDLYLYDIRSTQSEQITDANKALFSTLKKPEIRQKWVETSDHKKMLVWTILPPDFDENKKYPTLLYCQGGPQSPVSQFFSYRWNFMLMASQGYVVVAPNRRGLPGFGQEWNDAISKDWGGQAIRDYLSAIDDAAKEPYVDAERLGAVGASYGGYSVYFLAGVHKKRFKTFISHAGLFNLESWYGTTEELFFANWDNRGPYWLPENREYYAKNSPHRYVQNWDTPILVIHGGHDYRVPESEGMQAFQAAQLMGLRSKYLYFPTEGHWILSPQNGLVWHHEFFDWLAHDLK